MVKMEEKLGFSVKKTPKIVKIEMFTRWTLQFKGYYIHPYNISPFYFIQMHQIAFKERQIQIFVLKKPHPYHA